MADAERLDGGPRWQRSSYSDTAPNQCVEAAAAEDAVLIWDSKRVPGPRIAVSEDCWGVFLARVGPSRRP